MILSAPPSTQVYAIANAAVNVVLTFTMLLAGELSAAAKPHSSAEGAVELLVSAAATAAAPARRRLMIAAAAGDAAAAEGGEDPKLDYFYVFVLFVVYTGVGTVAMGWLSLSHFQAWRRRSTSQALTRQRPLRGDAAVAVSTSVIVAGGNVGALGSDDEGGAAGGALRRAGARDRAVGGNSALTPPPASSGSGSNSAGAGESVYQAVESAGFGIPGMRMGVVRRGLLRVLGFIVE